MQGRIWTVRSAAPADFAGAMPALRISRSELRELAREGQIVLHDMLGLREFDEEILMTLHQFACAASSHRCAKGQHVRIRSKLLACSRQFSRACPGSPHATEEEKACARAPV